MISRKVIRSVPIRLPKWSSVENFVWRTFEWELVRAVFHVEHCLYFCLKVFHVEHCKGWIEPGNGILVDLPLGILCRVREHLRTIAY